MKADLSDIQSADDLVARGIVSRESSNALEAYVDHLLHWQKRINLIGPATAARVWSRHIADSLQLLDHIPSGATTLADLGSGAGLPGLVIAIALKERPGFTVQLIESNAKKAAFLRSAIRETGARAEVVTVRIESLESVALQTACDVVTARALAPLHQLLDYTQVFLQNGAVALFLKGQDVDSELTETSKYWTIAYDRYPSRTDESGCILKVKEATRDARAP